MPSFLTLKFNSVPAVDTYISVSDGYVDNDLKETFKTVRTSAYQSTTGANVSAALINYINAFTADYNSGGLFSVLNIGDTVEIEHPNSGFFTNPNVDNTTAGAITVQSISDTTDPTSISITTANFNEAVSACENVELEITTDVLAVKYRINGGADVINAVNPFTFEHVRGAYINIEVENAEGNTGNRNVQVPETLSVSNTTVSVVNSPNGATVTAVVTNILQLELEYSLDDITYQDSNTFSSITAGSYTFYIKDQLGCSIEVPFTVEAFEDGGVGVQFPIADLPSKSNSIRFARYVDWGICTDYKNDENTLSCELAHTLNPRHINQLFQECDVITTQIRSNYETIVATVIQEDGTETSIPVDQKSDNIGLKDKRDSIKYNLGNGQTGIFFTSGNTYDFDTDVINGTYALNGGLPQFGTIGNFVLLGVSWFQIVDILFDESKNAEVIVIDDNYTGADVSVVVGAIYNAQDYDIYEFTINMGVYSNQKIQVNITETDTDPNFPDITFLSEIIDIKESHPNTVDITYFNDVNTDIFYSTGIINKIRIPIEYYVGGFSGDTEAERTDVSTILINAEVYENDEFHFDLLSKQIMRKVVQALSHKFVTIDEVPYVKEDDPTSTPLVGTNLYRLVAVMTKSDSVYTSQGTGVEFVATALEIPSLLEQTSGGYIKYKNN